MLNLLAFGYFQSYPWQHSFTSRGMSIRQSIATAIWRLISIIPPNYDIGETVKRQTNFYLHQFQINQTLLRWDLSFAHILYIPYKYASNFLSFGMVNIICNRKQFLTGPISHWLCLRIIWLVVSLLDNESFGKTVVITNFFLVPTNLVRLNFLTVFYNCLSNCNCSRILVI